MVAASSDNDADVIVVGAGPGGSTTAYHLARHGIRVLVLEKSQFPREKVCGDGLTPRAVKQLIKLGLTADGSFEEQGWLRNKGLRVIGGGVRLELDWPDLASFPNYGLVRTRLDFDDMRREAGREGRRRPAHRRDRHGPGRSTTPAARSASPPRPRVASRASSARR